MFSIKIPEKKALLQIYVMGLIRILYYFECLYSLVQLSSKMSHNPYFNKQEKYIYQHSELFKLLFKTVWPCRLPALSINFNGVTS